MTVTKYFEINNTKNNPKLSSRKKNKIKTENNEMYNQETKERTK